MCGHCGFVCDELCVVDVDGFVVGGIIVGYCLGGGYCCLACLLKIVVLGFDGFYDFLDVIE